METTIEIRRARPDDARGLAEVHIRTWRIAYAHLLPAETLSRLSVPARARRWERILRQNRNPTWIALEGARVLGFASSGPARDPEPPAERELYALYLDPDRHGSGVADALIREAIGDRPAYLWVLAGNARAIRFYEKHGFTLDGVERVEDAADGTPLPELRMARDAGSDVSARR
ncbi:GNAT family N-acetyltransferase [Microbacterium sp. JZ37]|uniref:GNAT family N-acetyltransferase n=1 Tax=Microbacterium sp. JZ37 TaxID=2654193 RepID=UPI002B47B94E|nr:GNAT family N-acetyltransferase [Microbacterium sp. JZ37]